MSVSNAAGRNGTDTRESQQSANRLKPREGAHLSLNVR